jgi:hypothetical protein
MVRGPASRIRCFHPCTPSEHEVLCEDHVRSVPDQPGRRGRRWLALDSDGCGGVRLGSRNEDPKARRPSALSPLTCVARERANRPPQIRMTPNERLAAIGEQLTLPGSRQLHVPEVTPALLLFLCITAHQVMVVRDARLTDSDGPDALGLPSLDHLVHLIGTLAAEATLLAHPHFLKIPLGFRLRNPSSDPTGRHTRIGTFGAPLRISNRAIAASDPETQPVVIAVG